MRISRIAISIPGCTALAVVYLWLVVELGGWSAQFSRPGLWLAKSIGLPHGMLAWMVVVNTISVILAAVPVALAAIAVFGRRAWIAALASAGVAAVFSGAESLNAVPWSEFLSPYPVVQVFDCIKLVVIPALLVIAIQRTPSNSRRSGPPVNRAPVSVNADTGGSGPRASGPLNQSASP